MSIQSEIDRISQAKSDLAAAIESKGVTVPPNTTINVYPGLVQQIEQGAGLPEGGTPGQMLYQGDSGPEWGDKPVMYVHITGNDPYTADKTFQEVKNAYDSGEAVIAVWNDLLVPLATGYEITEGQGLYFSTFDIINQSGSLTVIIFTQNEIQIINVPISAESISFQAGSNITSDNVQDAIDELAGSINEKQDKLTGTEGQVVGFNAAGEAVAQDAPESGMTQEQADQRYLQLSGGDISNLSVTSPLTIHPTGSTLGLMIMSASTGQLRDCISSMAGLWIVDRMGQPTESSIALADGKISLSGYNNAPIILTGLATPSVDNDAANKAYVDSKAPQYRTVTLTASGWSSNTQTVTVQGVSATETDQLIQPVPAIASQSAYYAAGILCTGQAENSLTFTCTETPTADLTVYVVIQEVSA